MQLRLLMVLLPFLLVACNNQDRAEQAAQRNAWDREYFVPVNDVEYKNYDRRQRIADDPTTILWCTSAFPIPSSPLFTVPIVGKLTSGSKRPFNNEPGPDAMYGSSGEYRYGFTPSGMYADWSGMPLFCTEEPTIWQRQQTNIVMQNDPQLTAAHNAAREALVAGDSAKAQQILEQAIGNLR